MNNVVISIPNENSLSIFNENIISLNIDEDVMKIKISKTVEYLPIKNWGDEYGFIRLDIDNSHSILHECKLIDSIDGSGVIEFNIGFNRIEQMNIID